MQIKKKEKKKRMEKKKKDKFNANHMNYHKWRLNSIV